MVNASACFGDGSTTICRAIICPLPCSLPLPSSPCCSTSIELPALETVSTFRITGFPELQRLDVARLRSTATLVLGQAVRSCPVRSCFGSQPVCCAGRAVEAAEHLLVPKAHHGGQRPPAVRPELVSYVQLLSAAPVRTNCPAVPLSHPISFDLCRSVTNGLQVTSMSNSPVLALEFPNLASAQSVLIDGWVPFPSTPVRSLFSPACCGSANRALMLGCRSSAPFAFRS